MACCDECARTGANCAQRAQLRRVSARLRAATGAAVGGGAGAVAGSEVPVVGTYTGGVVGAAAGSKIEDLISGGGEPRCSEPDCSFPTVEEWADEARRRGAPTAQIVAVGQRVNDQINALPSVSRQAFVRDVPNLRNGTMVRFMVARALSDLVASYPPILELSTDAATSAREQERGQKLARAASAPSVDVEPASSAGAWIVGGLVLAGVVAAGAAVVMKRRRRKNGRAPWKRR